MEIAETYPIPPFAPSPTSGSSRMGSAKEPQPSQDQLAVRQVEHRAQGAGGLDPRCPVRRPHCRCLWAQAGPNGDVLPCFENLAERNFR